MTERRVPRAESPPEDLNEIQIRERETTAAGIPAIVQTMRFGFGEMGALRTLKTLTNTEPEGWRRLPLLRLARPGRASVGCGVLRERRQGHLRRGDAFPCPARLLRRA